MQSPRLLSTLIAALLIAATPTLPFAAETAASKMAATPEVTNACAHVERDMKVAPECAKALEKPLSTEAELKALTAAAKSKDMAAVKEVLLKHGLTAEQLKDAKIVVNDDTKGGVAKSVGVHITCCPLTITITIKL